MPNLSRTELAELLDKLADDLRRGAPWRGALSGVQLTASAIESAATVGINDIAGERSAFQEALARACGSVGSIPLWGLVNADPEPVPAVLSRASGYVRWLDASMRIRSGFAPGVVSTSFDRSIGGLQLLRTIAFGHAPPRGIVLPQCRLAGGRMIPHADVMAMVERQRFGG
jgi:hypothetical protein